MTNKRNIYTIAEELGLAPSTVSKALNNNGKISIKTRERVKNHINEKGYTPSILARSLKTRNSLSIGVTYPLTTKNVMSHFFFASVIESFREYVERKGYEFCYVSRHLGEYEVSCAEYCRQRRLSGVLVLGATNEDEEMLEITEGETKVVSLDSISPYVPFIQSDDEDAAKQIVDYLKDKNLKNIAYISGPYNRGEFKKRTNLFYETLKSNDMSFDKENIIETKNTEYEDGFEGAVKLLKDNKKNVDVVIVSNDIMAFGAIRGIESLGYQVPEDISVIGFDDMFFSKYYTPSLTTVRQDCETIGYLAGKTLINLIKGKECLKVTYVPCKFIKRNSSK